MTASAAKSPELRMWFATQGMEVTLVQTLFFHPLLEQVTERFLNDQIKDELLRICANGYAKLPKFIFPTISEQLSQHKMPTLGIFCVANWFRFLLGVDEQGKPIPLEDKNSEGLASVIQSHLGNFAYQLSSASCLGDLRASDLFIKTATAHLENIYMVGVRSSLRCLLNP